MIFFSITQKRKAKSHQHTIFPRHTKAILPVIPLRRVVPHVLLVPTKTLSCHPSLPASPPTSARNTVYPSEPPPRPLPFSSSASPSIVYCSGSGSHFAFFHKPSIFHHRLRKKDFARQSLLLPSPSRQHHRIKPAHASLDLSPLHISIIALPPHLHYTQYSSWPCSGL